MILWSHRHLGHKGKAPEKNKARGRSAIRIKRASHSRPASPSGVPCLAVSFLGTTWRRFKSQNCQLSSGTRPRSDSPTQPAPPLTDQDLSEARCFQAQHQTFQTRPRFRWLQSQPLTRCYTACTPRKNSSNSPFLIFAPAFLSFKPPHHELVRLENSRVPGHVSRGVFHAFQGLAG